MVPLVVGADASSGRRRNVTDYDFIHAQVLELASQFDLQDVGFDPWNSTQMAIKLGEAGVEMVKFPQSPSVMNAPSKKLDRLVISRRLRHGGHPALRWNAANMAIVENQSGEIRPSEKRIADILPPLRTAPSEGSRFEADRSTGGPR